MVCNGQTWLTIWSKWCAMVKMLFSNRNGQKSSTTVCEIAVCQSGHTYTITIVSGPFKKCEWFTISTFDKTHIIHCSQIVASEKFGVTFFTKQEGTKTAQPAHPWYIPSSVVLRLAFFDCGGPPCFNACFFFLDFLPAFLGASSSELEELLELSSELDNNTTHQIKKSGNYGQSSGLQPPLGDASLQKSISTFQGGGARAMYKN